MPQPLNLSVSEVSALCGVSRARVYQRVTGYPVGRSGKAIDAQIVVTHQPGTRRGRQVRIPIAAALAWRDERAEAGKPIGPLPEAWGAEP